MTLVLSLIPFYLLGNLHCFGMCGPLVMMLSKHKFRFFYFFGRSLSFSLIGMLSGSFGIVLKMAFQGFNASAFLSFLFGLLFLFFAFGSAKNNFLPAKGTQFLMAISHKINLLLLKERRETTFYFGLATPLLPCGQSLFVFSISALLESPYTGLINGLIFSLLTSPSLYLALTFHKIWLGSKKHYEKTLVFSAFLAASFSFLRGLAELGLIPHLSFDAYHLNLAFF